MALLAGVYESTPLNTSEIPQSELNIESKYRSNPLPWTGQFSPQLVQVLLDRYASAEATVLDPFAGSGTVLFEAGRIGVPALGVEINPAAVILARVYTLINTPLEVRHYVIQSLNSQLQRLFTDSLPILQGRNQNRNKDNIKHALADIAAVTTSSPASILMQALVVLSDFYKEDISVERILAAWRKLSHIVSQLPYSQSPVSVFHSDARRIPSANFSVDIVVTSPPYINVFNYHQRYRESAEYLRWNLLEVARSEIGSNRKHRGNRFLTVIQYCLDITQTLQELQRVTRPTGRLIFIVGRESMVRGARLYNGEIVAEIAHQALGFNVVLRQERVFTNRYGQSIYEDVLHFVPSAQRSCEYTLDCSRTIATKVLEATAKHAPRESRADIADALKLLPNVRPSPVFDPETAITSMIEGA